MIDKTLPCWDLSPVFSSPDGDDFRQALSSVSDLCSSLSSRLANGCSIASVLDDYNRLLATYETLGAYSSCLLTTDTTCEAYLKAVTDVETEHLLGIPAGTPISYRAGDQPNNAFSLNVLEPGEVAATGGTSGVVYGVTDAAMVDPQSRVNTFVHVNHTSGKPRYGVLLCINGTGIMNSWLRRYVMQQTLDYQDMNTLAASVPVGSEGVVVLPFGNGAERMFGNRTMGAAILNLDLNRHSTAHLLRAAQEGIACSFRYGIDIMRMLGLKLDVIRAGAANLFLSPLFRQTLATLTGARIELFNTDGALGAARGAAFGAGYYRTREEAFASLRRVETVEPVASDSEVLEKTYRTWVTAVESKLNNTKILG